MKNEMPYISEWVAHHLSIGFDSITVYDNESSDGTSALLDKLSTFLPINRIHWAVEEGSSPQLTAYNHALLSASGPAYFAFFDADEFLIPVKKFSLKHLISDLERQHPDLGAIVINQRVFGSSGHEFASNEPVMMRFRMCSRSQHPENTWVKSIYRAGHVRKITNAHSSCIEGIHVHPSGEIAQFDQSSRSEYGKTIKIDHSSLQLNHYITKSLEEFRVKQLRGGAMARTKKNRLTRYPEEFFFRRQQHASAMVDVDSTSYAERISSLIAALPSINVDSSE